MPHGSNSLCRTVKVLAVGTLEPYAPGEVLTLPNPVSDPWQILLARPMERSGVLEVSDVAGRSIHR